jgi:hypothetical protein
MYNIPFYSFRFSLSNCFGLLWFELWVRNFQNQNCGVSSWEKWTFPTTSSDATSAHRRTFPTRPRVWMCRQCPRTRAMNVRHSGRVRATMRLMSVFLFRIKGLSCPNTREHERPDYTSRAAQSHVSEQSEQLSGVVGLIVVKLHPPFSVLPRFSDSSAMISQILITCTNKIVRRRSNLYIFHLCLLSLEWQASGVTAMCGRVQSPTNYSVNHSWSNLGECIRRYGSHGSCELVMDFWQINMWR